MTIIAYHNGQLGTDSRGISEMNEPDQTHYTLQKLWIHSENGKPVLAMAKSGHSVEARVIMPFMKILYNFCEQAELYQKDTKFEILPVLKDIFGSDSLTGILIMTHRHLYRFDDTHFYQRLDCGPVFLGSGRNVARTAIFGFDASLKEALQKAVALDVCCGGEIHIVSKKDLSPIVEVKSAKKRGPKCTTGAQ